MTPPKIRAIRVIDDRLIFELAQDREPGDNEVKFRWTFSFEPAF